MVGYCFLSWNQKLCYLVACQNELLLLEWEAGHCSGKESFIIKFIPADDEIDTLLCRNRLKMVVSAEGPVVESCGCTTQGKDSWKNDFVRFTLISLNRPLVSLKLCLWRHLYLYELSKKYCYLPYLLPHHRLLRCRSNDH